MVQRPLFSDLGGQNLDCENRRIFRLLLWYFSAAQSNRRKIRLFSQARQNSRDENLLKERSSPRMAYDVLQIHNQGPAFRRNPLD